MPVGPLNGANTAASSREMTLRRSARTHCDFSDVTAAPFHDSSVSVCAKSGCASLLKSLGTQAAADLKGNDGPATTPETCSNVNTDGSSTESGRALSPSMPSFFLKKPRHMPQRPGRLDLRRVRQEDEQFRRLVGPHDAEGVRRRLHHECGRQHRRAAFRAMVCSWPVENVMFRSPRYKCSKGKGLSPML